MIGLAALLLTQSIDPALDRDEKIAPVTVQGEVNASPDEVWEAFTTEHGVVGFFAPSAKVEPRIGGAYEMFFQPDRPAGLRGGEGNRILAMEPNRRLLVSWNAPTTFGPLRAQHTVVEFTIAPQGEKRTLVTASHSAWGKGADWRAVRNYFSSAWPVVLGRLQYRFDRGRVDWTNMPPGAEYFRPQAPELK